MKPGAIVRYTGNTVPDLHGRRGRLDHIGRNGWLHVAFGKAEPVKCSAHNIEPDDGESFFGMACPDCGRSDKIDVSAIICVRIVGDVASGDAETDADAAQDRSHEWDGNSSAQCQACGYFGTVASFQMPDE